jgi:hypothetical protein
MQARLVTFKPHVLRFHEICFGSFRSISTAFEDTQDEVCAANDVSNAK